MASKISVCKIIQGFILAYGKVPCWCSLGGTFCLHFDGQSSTSKQSALPVYITSTHTHPSHFNPEDGGRIFVKNITNASHFHAVSPLKSESPLRHAIIIN
jgi:hypothetical protein